MKTRYRIIKKKILIDEIKRKNCDEDGRVLIDGVPVNILERAFPPKEALERL